MSRAPADSLSIKRKRPDTNPSTKNLSEPERVVYEVIRKKEDMGIWLRDLKKDANLGDAIVTRSLKSLQLKNLVKEVVNIQNKSKKHYMAVEFEPSKELTGGAWYVDGKFDSEFIDALKGLCKRVILNQKLATVEMVTDAIKQSRSLNVECSMQQIADIIQSLVWENEIVEVRSSGGVRYKCASKAVAGSKAGAMASIPCGVCPRINECAPDGVISPITCVYYNKWLDF